MRMEIERKRCFRIASTIEWVNCRVVMELLIQKLLLFTRPVVVCKEL